MSPETDQLRTEDPSERRENLFFLFVILAVTVIAYAPMVDSVIRLSARTTQALNAFMLLGFTFADAFMTAWKTHRFGPAINRHGMILFACSCLALVLASVSSLWPLAVLGLCLNVGALLSFCWGRAGVVPFYPALTGLGAAVAMLVFVPSLDELLRTVAAYCSAWALSLAGIQADIVQGAAPFHIVLVAEKGAGVFDVATECNGFGIILSSVVVSIVLTLRRRYPWGLAAGLLVLSAVLGLAFNTLRIVAIAVASLQTDVDYGLIHEGLGTVVYLVALGVVYRLIGWASRLAASPTGARPISRH